MTAELLAAADEEAALDMLHDLACTDGLPVVIPTQERVDRLILASALDRDMVLGEMGPALGIATIEKVATAAVMAGCKPDYMPLVIAAVKAVVDPVFDLSCALPIPRHILRYVPVRFGRVVTESFQHIYSDFFCLAVYRMLAEPFE